MERVQLAERFNQKQMVRDILIAIEDNDNKAYRAELDCQGRGKGDVEGSHCGSLGGLVQVKRFRT